MHAKSLKPDFSYVKVTLEEARKVLDEPPARKQTRRSPRIKRSPPVAEKLFAFTAKWILGLPASVRTMQLGKLYPRIANELCRHWPNPGQWDRYMANLLIVGRDGQARKGFPPDVASELVALNEYHARLYPPAPETTVASSVWHSVATSRRG